MDFLTLFSGVDIPFTEGNLIYHPLRIKDIGYIGEKTFFSGCEFLNFSKDKFLSEKDKFNLQDKSNFDIFIDMMNNPNPEIQIIKNNTLQFLTLIFPDYDINIQKNQILFTTESNSLGRIDNSNYERFKEILSFTCCIKSDKTQNDYNPEGDYAAKIAAKLKERQKKLSELKGGDEGKRSSIFQQYTSVLSIGNHQDVNEILNYTVYQLFYMFRLFMMSYSDDMKIRSMLAGAKDVGKLEDWMQQNINLFE